MVIVPILHRGRLAPPGAGPAASPADRRVRRHRARVPDAPPGEFQLAAARDFAGGFAPGMGASLDEPDPTALLVVFPVEGWASSAAVELRQEPDGSIVGRVFGTDDVAGARTQALRCLSLDHDGSGWPEVGRRDPVIGALQQRYGMLRPVCFLSAWEAATSFVIGQRISMRQGAVVKRWLSETVGRRHRAAGWPDRPRLPRLRRRCWVGRGAGHLGREGRRLQGLARAALDGALDTQTLRDLPEAEALDASGGAAGHRAVDRQRPS